MNLKIIKRSAIIWNVSLHIIMSIAFVFLQKAILEENSIFNIEFVISIIVPVSPLIITGIISVYYILKLKNISRYVYFLFVVSIASYITYSLITEFSKLVLIVLFIYILISYYLFFILSSELDQSYNNPGFSSRDLFDPMLFKININLLNTKNNHSVTGLLTNWNEDGCFVKLDSELKKGSHLELEVIYKENIFKEKVVIVTMLKNKKGVGLKFKDKSSGNSSWSDLYKIISDMGMSVEYVQ